MPKRLSLLTVRGQAVVDIEDGHLVLDERQQFVEPKDAQFVTSSPYPIEVELLNPEIPISAFVDSSSVMKVLSVEHVDTLEYTDITLLLIDGPATGCRCVILGYVTVKTILEDL